VVYPQGAIPFDGGYAWNVPNEPIYGGSAVPKGSPSDLTYLLAVVKRVERRYCVDPQEVYATGFSGGAREVSQLACDASSVFAAVAPVSGLRRPTPCPTTRAVPVISFHGSADPVDPFAGHGQPYWSYSVKTAAKDWAQQDHCSGSATKTTPAPGVKLSLYAHCSNGASVELYEVMGEGHEWPGGPTLPPALTKALGPQSNAINANALMWAFFSAHPLS
jgi:polyhydroxybutyrate depolymerase